MSYAKAREKVRRYLHRKTAAVNRAGRKASSVASVNFKWRYTTSHGVGRSKKYEEVYIYGLADPRDHVIRYVGKTVRGDIGARVREHIEEPTNVLMATWLHNLSGLGFLPEHVAIEICTRDTWEAAERKWIARLRSVGSLLNIENGGDSERARRERWHSWGLGVPGGPVRNLSKAEIADMESRLKP